MQEKKKKKLIMYTSPFHYILYSGTNVTIYIINQAKCRDH